MLNFFLDYATPGYTQEGPTAAVYNHGWVIGDPCAVSVAVQAQMDNLLEAVPAEMSQAENPERLQARARGDVEDVRQLMGASTPHFALQLRERIRTLIRGLPDGASGEGRGRARDRSAGSDRVRGRGPRAPGRAGAGADAERHRRRSD